MYILGRKAALILHASLVTVTFLCQYAKAKEGLLSLSRPLVVRWSYEPSELSSLSPAAHDNLIYTPLPQGVLAAIRRQDGQLMWRAETGGELSAAPAADERGVYIASELSTTIGAGTPVYTKGVVRALSKTSGVTLWTRTVPNPLGGALVLGLDTLYGASSDGRIYSLDKKTGTPVWIAQLQHSFSSSPVLADGRLYVASDDGTLLALEVKTGAVLWHYRTRASGPLPFAVQQGMLYVGSSDGYVTALSETGGRLRSVWRRRAGTSVQTLSATPSGLVVTSLDNFVHFLSYRRGDRLWKKQMPGRILSQPLIDSGSALFTPVGGEACIALSLSNGKQVNTLPVGEGNAVIAPPLIVDSFLIIPTRRGLLAFAPAGAAP